MSLGRVHAKVALVTGAGSGIGRATAIVLAREGAVVTVSDVDARAADRVAREIRDMGGSSGGAAEALGLDVAEESAWNAAIEAILARHRRLDVLVNNAGVSFTRPVAETALDDWRRVLSVNLDGVFLGTRSAIHAMKPGGGGSIINVSSVSGVNAYPGASAYAASKAAVRLFSKIAAIECLDAGTGIRINLVTPGGVKTPMWETMDFFRTLITEHGGTEGAFAALAGTTPSHQFSTPEDVARTILYLASDESSHLTGVELVIANGHVG
jgi:NAD(P)-dependent dehydrogenase (short-subunit alcohol dehydrogenase family)